MLFMDGLLEPLQGWVKGHDPATLQEATKKARDLDPSSFRSRFEHKDSYMKREKEKDKKPCHKDAQPKRDKLDNHTLNDFRKKKLCFIVESFGIYLISVLSRLRQIKWSISHQKSHSQRGRINTPI